MLFLVVLKTKRGLTINKKFHSICRCGLYNTKLLKAYLAFDDRVLPLMTLVKIWIQSLSGVRISNYALMIMIIHCLQRTTPPLLPCLQRCDPWPRNMAWFVKEGFASSGIGERVEVAVDGWNFNFLHHRSLMPSQNKSTIGWSKFIFENNVQ